jgi:hypothetical protein
VNQTRRVDVLRIAIVLVMGLAWFGITNHCALGGLIATETQPPMLQMHCHGNQPSPSKKSSDEEMPCCKVLRATLATQPKIIQIASTDFLPIQSWIVAQILFANEAQLHRVTQEFDTGPPFAGTFAESVLQRSVLAHAPPFLA